MTEIEKRVYNNTSLVQVTLVVDCDKDVHELLVQLTEAIAKTDHNFFAARFKHGCDGGLITLGERQAHRAIIERTAADTFTESAGTDMVALAASLLGV
jgi:hypothetical protein